MPNTIAENLQRLVNARTAISDAITAKGGTVNAGDGFEDFPADIATIPSGGGGANFATREVDFINNTTSIIEGTIAAVTTYGNMRRCNVADDGAITAFYGDRSYTEDGSNGQVMVYVPKFYYKLDVSQNGDIENNKIRHGKWSISDASIPGYKLHPAFKGRTGDDEVDYFLYGAFDAVGQDNNGVYSSSFNTSAYKLASIGGNTHTPINSLTIETANTMAKNRGTGWYQIYTPQVMAIQMLLAVEYGFNSQLTVGKGLCDTNGLENTGQTLGIGTSGNTNNGLLPINYHGIENFWGNIYNYMGGIFFYRDTQLVKKICISTTLGNLQSMNIVINSFTVPNQTNGIISAFGYDESNDWVFIPAELSSNIDYTSTIGDSGGSTEKYNTIVRFGGSFGFGNSAGAFNFNGQYSEDKAFANSGCRLMYMPTSNQNQ
jgi:hypothetical protein